MIESSIRIGHADPNRTRLPGGDATVPPSTLLGGRYRLERVIGEGAFGRVFLAFDTRLQDYVAIKELLSTRNTSVHPTFDRYLARFQREARAARGAKHPNIVTVYDLYVDDAGNNYLVMEYVDGKNLRDLLAKIGALPVERAVAIALDIAHALEAIHEREIVHRDIKPANIMISHRGSAKLTDFGVALVASEANTTVSGDGHPGTVPYMSPEQASGYGLLDGRSDVYSLGLVLYEMLVGKPYAAIRQPLQTMRPDLPASLIAIVDGMMQRTLARRYPSATMVAADLQRFARALVAPPEPPRSPEPAQPALPAQPPEPPPFLPQFIPRPPEPPKRTHGPIFALIGAAVVVAVSIAIYFAMQSQMPAPVQPTPTAAPVRPTVAPTTVPATVVPPTAAPATSVPPTTAPPTTVPPTTAPPTTVPPTVAPVSGTAPWSAPNGLVSVHYPSAWATGRDTKNANNLVFFDSHDGTFVYINANDPQQGTVPDEIQIIRRNFANDTNNTYTDIVVTDTRVNGEPAQTLVYSVAPKSNPSAKVKSEWWIVNHDNREIGFLAYNIGTHRAEVEAIVNTATLTTTWTDAKGLVRLQIPNGWAASVNSADGNNVLELRGPDGAFFSVRIFDPAFGTLDQEIQDFFNAHKNDKDFTYRDGAPRDLQVGREPAKTFSFTAIAKSNGTQADGAIWEVNHGPTEFQFQAAAIGSHRTEIDAIIASVTFLK